MAPTYSTLKELEFYSYGKTFCKARVVQLDEFKKNYISLSKESTFTNESGEQKTSRSFVVYTIPAAEKLLSLLGSLIEDAKCLSGVCVCGNF